MSGSHTHGHARSRLRRIAVLASSIVLAMALSTCGDRAPTAPRAVAPAEQVTVAASRDTARVIVGTTFQLAAMVENPVGHALPNKQHTVWVSTRPAVASVDSTGRVVGVDTGRALVIAVHKKTADTVRVHVVPVPVARVVVTPAAATIEVGEPVTLTAATLDSIGGPLAGRAVAWSSSDGLRAWVSAGGIVTGSAPGVAVVAAESEGQRDSATVTVLVPWVLDVTARTMGVGERLQLHALREAMVLEGASWATSDSAIATVSATGEVRAVAPGTATITARWGWSGDAPRTATITVVEPVYSVSIEPHNPAVEAGTTRQLTAVLRDRAGRELTGRTVTWTSAHPQNATVSSEGLVTGVTADRGASITASSEGRSASTWVYVMPAWSVETPVLTLPVGESYQLVTTEHVITGTSWISDAPSVARITSSGMVTGVSPGTATITVTWYGLSHTSTVRVVPPLIMSYTFQPAQPTITVGTTQAISVTLRDRFGNVLTDRQLGWATSDPAIATVSASGAVTGIAPGLATITVSSGDWSATLSVAVIASGGAVASVTLTPSAATIVALDWPRPASFVVTLRDAGGNVVRGRLLSAVSLDTSISAVTVFGDSLIKASGKRAGVTTIRASAEGRTADATVTVLPPPVASIELQPMMNGNAVGGTGCDEPSSHGVVSAFPKDRWGNPLDRPIAWSSSSSVVIVTPITESISYPPYWRPTNRAEITIVGLGTATITATSEGVNASFTITSRRCTNQTTLVPTEATLTVGQQLQLTSTTIVTDYNGGQPLVVPPASSMVQWWSSNPAVATVAADGRVTALAPGQTVISVSANVRLWTSYASSGAQATITVVAP